MRQTFFIILSLLIGQTLYSRTDSVRGKQFQLTGKITGEIVLTPHCGYFAEATVIEFEASNLLGLTYNNKSIGIIIRCPSDSYSKTFFQKGKRYQVVFSDTNQADVGWTIANRDLLKKNGLSFDPCAISIKEIP